ncbi:hypothetical protein K439DRAFT_1513720 [Ramaria rubella]|nr:hypothetical protein K439DRAFT_1513720 [Ramaria rubella]
MPKRVAVKPSGASTSSKRPKRGHAFGGSSVDDQDPLTTQLSAPTSTALSTRIPTSSGVCALTTLCARVFVTNLEFLFQNRRDETQQWLKILPDAIIPRLFSMLSASHPSRLSHPFISTFFLRGDPIVLTGTLPGVSPLTIKALSKVDSSLRALHLTELTKVSDDVVARLLSGFPALEILNLRSVSKSSKVSQKTVEAAAQSCKGLKSLNLSYTSAPIVSISLLTAECLRLEVLKLAGLSNLTDAGFASIAHIEVSVKEQHRPLACLRSLKLRHTLVSELSLSRAIPRCPALLRLDVSFTPIRQPTVLYDQPPNFSLEKLSLTSTPLTSAFLQTLGSSKFSRSIFTSLRTLHIGALGASPSSSVSTLAGSHTLTDQILDSLSELLMQCKSLDSISLVGNTKLGFYTVNSPLATFVRKVGRRCKILNLSSIPRLRSSDLVGLLPLDGGVQLKDSDIMEGPTAYAPSSLRTLILNQTDVGDEAAPYIASCIYLTTLEIAGTKFGCK